MRMPDSSCLAGMPRIQFKTRTLNPTVTFVIVGTGKTQTPFAGSWEAILGGGPDWTIQLEIDGGMVRGTVLELPLPILDGKVDGTTLSFKVKNRTGTRTITFTGTVHGDELNFTREVENAAGGPSGPGLFGNVGLSSFSARRIR
jgi:autotransporter translocation and assembly factor TamB